MISFSWKILSEIPSRYEREYGRRNKQLKRAKEGDL
jgi:hypothetical protein